MAVITDNKYLQSLLDDLIVSYETELNYSPIDIELDPSQISEKDQETLKLFLTEPRKRLFNFKIKGQDDLNLQLALIARKAVLEQTAAVILQSTNEPKVNPLKIAMSNPPTTVLTGIQIQKSYFIGAKPIEHQESAVNELALNDSQAVELVAVNFPDMPHLNNQLHALGITEIQADAVQLIKDNAHAFTDGLIPSNLPKGFYFNKNSLRFTANPTRLPTALAPVLEQPAPLLMPDIKHLKAISNLNENIITQLLNDEDTANQSLALANSLTFAKVELTDFLKNTSSAQKQTLSSFFAKQFLLGGENHLLVLCKSLKNCVNKKLSIDFLTNPVTQNGLVSARGVKNLQKLLRLPAEQREWWNVLTTKHLENNNHHFDFNVFFEAYTQVFLPRIAEKNLSLPQPCPINHEGHFLITLNRVLEVIELSVNPQEQCLNLNGINWGPTGAHFAMTQASVHPQMKQVARCMELNNAEDIHIEPEQIIKDLELEAFNIQTWFFRFVGAHWKHEVRLINIQEQIETINQIPQWTPAQKNQLLFILACTYANASPDSKNPDLIMNHLIACLAMLKDLSSDDRGSLLKALTHCFKFKPNPSLSDISNIISQCIELKNEFKDQNFSETIITPFVNSLEHDGFELLNTLKERISKTIPEDKKAASLSVFAFYNLLEKNKVTLNPQLITILAKVNEPNLTQESYDKLLAAFNRLNHFSPFSHATFLKTLSHLNVSKTSNLPNIDSLVHLINSFIATAKPVPQDNKMRFNEDEEWLIDYILQKNLLPGCVFGNGDISKLGDLIVDALVDTVKKRAAVLRINMLKQALLAKVPDSFKELKQQLNDDFIPLLDAVKSLIDLLQSPNPQFKGDGENDGVIEQLRKFEEKKPKILEAVFDLSILGKPKGKYILSILLTGQLHKEDNLNNSTLNWMLKKVHGLILEDIHNATKNPNFSALVKDLDADTLISWMKAFNDTYSLAFLFREELVSKKVVPALKKTLVLLDTHDPIFEKSILDAADDLSDKEGMHIALQNYKDKIESISAYLNSLIDVKKQLSANHPERFILVYQKLQEIVQLNYDQKQNLLHTLQLYVSDSSEWEWYFTQTARALDDNPAADQDAINSALLGLKTLFEIQGLDTHTQKMFFNMSLAHNLRSKTPFPLVDLNLFKQSSLPEATKSLLLKEMIHIISHMGPNDSVDLIRGLVQETLNYLSKNPEQATLCHALLKQITTEHLGRDLNNYSAILQQLSQLKEYHSEHLPIILKKIAANKKDDSVNLTLLLEITKRISRQSIEEVAMVLTLFTTPPYPNAQILNSLLTYGSENLRAYCQSFDTNPYTKPGVARPLEQQFTSAMIKAALLSLRDLQHEINLPHSLQLKLARQLNYIEILGYTDPLNPSDFSTLKKLTATSRHELKTQAMELLTQLRSKSVSDDALELTQLHLLACLREIYYRSTGLFPNSTQMLMLLISLNMTDDVNVLMSIKTGEGKSLITPMLAVLQWAQGGTVNVCTANGTLLERDYENNCEPFFQFLGIESTLIRSNTDPKDYKLNGINCSTLEYMALFRLAAKESKLQKYIDNGQPTHLILDECDDGLLDQTTLYKLVAEVSAGNAETSSASWIYPLAYEFINLPAFQNIGDNSWDEEEDLDQLRQFINKRINEKYEGDAEKQNFMMATTNTELRQWINASCKAATLVENKHYIIQSLEEKDPITNDTKIKKVCVPLAKSTPKTGCIFTNGVQQALTAKLIAERPDIARFLSIAADPEVLASQSARGLINDHLKTKGRLVGISGTPGNPIELEYLNTIYGTQAIGVAPYAGDKRQRHTPIYSFSRDETYKSIEQCIKKIKQPLTVPNMDIDPDSSLQTLQDQTRLINQTKEALERWNNQQTQPIAIICEDFKEAQLLGERFATYEAEGFKIQVVTGRESPEQLSAYIKRAGRANTITIGTAMLARGIDINPGDHPEGLFVFQVYPDSLRMTTQIGGRAARNGKPGQWQPIYQVKPPEQFIAKILYFLFSSYRKRYNQDYIAKIQTQIQLQDTIDRLYTQAIDQTQQTLIQQIDAWETLLQELYPDDPKLKFELYEWRETLLSELTHLQENNITQDTLKGSISQFNNSLNKLWETSKEEKWLARANKANHLSIEQSLRLNFLKNIDFNQELTIQTKLQNNAQPFTKGSKDLMQQNLNAMIDDKAGASIHFDNPINEERNELLLAQTRQILPSLIGELCSLYPQALRKLEDDSSNNSMPQILVDIVHKVIDQKNKIFFGSKNQEEITQEIIQSFKHILESESPDKINEWLLKMRHLIIEHAESLTDATLVKKFKIQGMIQQFHSLSVAAGLPKDNKFSKIKNEYGLRIMKTLAIHLMNELEWVKEKPESIHAFLERRIAKEAANSIYDLAVIVQQNPQDEVAIQNLYKNLQKNKVWLEDKILFSFSHKSPKLVINEALEAVESLNNPPHCDPAFQKKTHDDVLTEIHLNQFLNCLTQTAAAYKDKSDLIWNYFHDKLNEIAKKNKYHSVLELDEAVERFSKYEAYKPYKREFKTLKSKLSKSLKGLEHLIENPQNSFFATKKQEYASVYQVEEENLVIQKGTDGLDSFIEVQIKSAELIEGFTGYVSPAEQLLRSEQTSFQELQGTLEKNKENLLHLSDVSVIDTLPEKFKDKFNQLFTIKALLEKNDWNALAQLKLDLPNEIKNQLRGINEFNTDDWKKNYINLDTVEFFIPKLSEEFLGCVARKSQLLKLDSSLDIQLASKAKELEGLILSVSESEAELKGLSTAAAMVSFGIKSKITKDKKTIENIRKNIEELSAAKPHYARELDNLNNYFEQMRAFFIQTLIISCTSSLHKEFDKRSLVLVELMEKELDDADKACESLIAGEHDKAQYQTQRFFSIRDALQFEARQAKEEENIPVMVR